MKTIPRRKKIALQENEIRVINIGEDAIWEFLNENLLDITREVFDLRESDDVVSTVYWSSRNKCLTYAITPVKLKTNHQEIDLERLFRKIGYTTDSLFKPFNRHYVRYKATGDCLREP